MAGPRLGRYELHDEIASGGMATVHLGRLVGPVGFSRVVAIKRLHPHFAKDPQFVAMFVDEARLAARIRHPHVVPTLDVVLLDGEVFLVMDYVQGESLAHLRSAANGPLPVRVATGIVAGVLDGLHAAHEATDDKGTPLEIVHRDVSPQNILVGVDGVARVVDFGVAKAQSRLVTTEEGQVKGKVAYMSPEQLLDEALDRRTDVYAAAVVLWEALAGRRLFVAGSPGAMVNVVLRGTHDPPSKHNLMVSPELDGIVMRGLAHSREARFATAREMALALERAEAAASPREIAAWVEQVAGDWLSERAHAVARTEVGSVATALLSAGELEAPVRAEGPKDEPNAPITALSAATPSRPRASPQSARRAWLLAAALAMVLAVLGVTQRRRLDALRYRPPPAPASSSVAVSALAPEPTPPAVSTTVSAALPTATPPSASPTGSSSVGPRTPPRPPFRPAPSKAAHGECDPPFTIDNEGLKVFKPHCLH